MTREEKQKAVDALKISAPIMAMTQEEFNDYIQTINQIMDWLEQEPCEDTISRKAVIDTLERMDKALDEDRTVENYKELLRECYKVLPSVKPKSEWEHDHEILKAYSDGASAVLESIKYLIEQYEHYLELLDADMKDGSATIVTKTKYAVYTEVVKQLKELLEEVFRLGKGGE